MGSKSKPGPTTTSSSSTSIPDWLSNAAQGAVATAQDLSQRPYTPYTGQQVADVPADTLQAYQQIRDMQGQTQPIYQQSEQALSGLLGQVNPITAGGVNQIANQLYGNYQQNIIDPSAGLLGGYLQGGPATAQQVGNNAQQLMSPYAQSVIAPTLQAGQQQLALANQNIANQANNVGAFGGSRQGVQEGVAAAQTALGTQQQIANLMNTGWNAALTPSQALALQAGSQGYSAASGLAGMLQSGYGNAATQAGGIANTNLQAGMTAAQQLPGIATAQQAANQKDASLLQTIGAAQQQQQQQLLNQQIGQYYEQQNWPVQNMDLLLSALGGVPYSTSSMSTGTGPSSSRNVAGGVAGGALSGAATGAALGPYGAAAGAVIGGILGGIG